VISEVWFCRCNRGKQKTKRLRFEFCPQKNFDQAVVFELSSLYSLFPLHYYYYYYLGGGEGLRLILKRTSEFMLHGLGEGGGKGAHHSTQAEELSLVHFAVLSFIVDLQRNIKVSVVLGIRSALNFSGNSVALGNGDDILQVENGLLPVSILCLWTWKDVRRH